MARNHRHGQQFRGRNQLPDDIENDLALIDTASNRLRRKFEIQKNENNQLRKLVSELQEELRRTRAVAAKHEKEVIELRQQVNELGIQREETSLTQSVDSGKRKLLQLRGITYSIGM